ncbi:Ubiquitin fusion degradation protein UFD1 [Penicillium canescens]|uniref:Ubiquitin fusion degradation protein 1 n=1 Tax=Penicillium canescens TaxID=5083 RepID=A0AAD6I3E6_PENCN|nr:Ubiquitin fusion degradation protein UFD1 [Penicillium canescens]KAJ6008877.1 Ubiquitin fusion degradation protein UFD1 [Penicillium canescens]KAJ6027618.1 Ubiquitin fusion degradation protein UFD1 [Penicillium canescens]KAJ6040896.1 Ubiquitin fusion degradation protein UFD1 [Penicillium canescens]KAJ6066749.1 Ubiquitin fusion degradation protein UFD1 [Penicillium canescens]KAJ6101446.1 Ubiquitin fusion degradation protein UFD1 [Penicillium canescens]
MFRPDYWSDDPMDGVLGAGMMRPGAAARRFDEYYRCYPVAMLPGPERENVNHGGKVIMPPSALDKLTRLHITYPMMFELHNGAKERMTHAGVLEFIAEEGKIYLPFWLMQTLLLEPGDLLQIKSTDLPPGQFIKLQAQSTSFLDISDPKAVLENAFRNFSCLTKGDVFTFAYNDQVYEMAVLETKPSGSKSAVSVLETDLEVDFAAPVGYEESQKTSGTSTPGSVIGGKLPPGGLLHPHGTMAQSINYTAIAPEATEAAAGARAASSNFLSGGQRLNAKKGSKAPTPNPSTPAPGTSNPQHPPPARRLNGPQPLRLPPNQLFFGYTIKPVKKRDENGQVVQEDQPKFQGIGQTLRGKRKDLGSETPTSGSEAGSSKGKESSKNSKGGRTLR